MQSQERPRLVPFFFLYLLQSQEGHTTSLSSLGASGEAGPHPKGLRCFLCCTKPQNPYPTPSQTNYSH